MYIVPIGIIWMFLGLQQKVAKLTKPERMQIKNEKSSAFEGNLLNYCDRKVYQAIMRLIAGYWRRTLLRG